MAISIQPLTPGRWDDLVILFGPERGAHGGGWCMWWRMTTAVFEKTSRADRRDNFRAIVESGAPTGVLAYAGQTPIGWCAVGPRDSLPKLMRSRVAKPLEGDADKVWMINCFFVDRGHREAGLMGVLIDGALGYARENGARMVEACPVEPARPLIWGEAFIGIASVFREAGFDEVARRSPTRPLMRIAV
jgi:predicted GNAT family acetyltransferase